MQGDFFLRTAFPNKATGESVREPDAPEEEVRRIPGVTSVDTVRFFDTKVVALYKKKKKKKKN